MTSPLIPSPFIYGDIPGGGNIAVLITSPVAPSVTQNQASIGSFWLQSLNLSTQVGTAAPTYGNGKLYYLAGFTNGVPQWTQILSSLPNTVGTTPNMSGSGTVTVSDPLVTATSKIIFSRNVTGGTVGNVAISAQTAGSFTLTSTSATETSTFNYIVSN